MEMKVIDLLNKIANGEEIPKVIKYDGVIFELDKFENCYLYEMQDLSEFMIFNSNSLNEKVEIIEEDKKIEKVNTYVLCDRDFETMGKHSTKATEIIDKAFEEYSYKINEIIDKLEEK